MNFKVQWAEITSGKLETNKLLVGRTDMPLNEDFTVAVDLGLRTTNHPSVEGQTMIAVRSLRLTMFNSYKFI